MVLPKGSELLLGLLRWDEPLYSRAELSGIAGAEWAALLGLARQHAVGSLLYHRLQQHGLHTAVPVPVGEALAASYRINALRNARILRELGEIARLAATRGIEVIVLKGAAVAASAYEHAAARTMGDLDVLVPLERLVEFVALLEMLGYRSQGDLSQRTLLKHHHWPPCTKPNGVCPVEVHWTIVDKKEAAKLAIGDWWRRAVPLALPDGAPLWMFSAEDTVLHAGAHATHQHQLALVLRSLCDIAQVVQVQSVDWDGVRRRAVDYRWQRGIYLALQLARDLLGAAVPDSVLSALAPPAGHRSRVVSTAPLQLMSLPLPDLTKGAPLRLSEGVGVRQRLGKVWRGIFLPRAVLATMYPVNPDSPGWPLGYALRVRDLARHYGRLLLLLRRQRRFHQWLNNG